MRSIRFHNRTIRLTLKRDAGSTTLSSRRIGAAGLVLLVLMAQACGSDAVELRSCPSEPAVTELCVVHAGAGSAVDRLSAVNTVDHSKDITPDTEDPSALLTEVISTRATS